MNYIAIAAMNSSRVIGKDSRMPWHVPADLALFKKLTLGHWVVMGRKTFESIGKALPGRFNIVLTRSADFRAEGVTVIHGIDELRELEQRLQPDKPVIIMGGAEIYRLFLPYTERLWLSMLDNQLQGDTWFPPFEHEFSLVRSEAHAGFEWQEYQRKHPAAASPQTCSTPTP